MAISKDEQIIIDNALTILRSELSTNRVDLSSVPNVKNFCKLKIATLHYEVFGILFLNTKSELIEDMEMFRGTLDSAPVFPREVAKAALDFNAKSVIFYHNHPSGNVEASTADRQITDRLIEALRLIDVSVFDHIIVTLDECLSFAEKGLI